MVISHSHRPANYLSLRSQVPVAIDHTGQKREVETGGVKIPYTHFNKKRLS